MAARTRRGVALVGTVALLCVVLVGARTTRAESARYAGTIGFLRWPNGAADYSDGPSLYVIDADGSGLRRLTPPGTSVLGYQWSPNGQTVAYTDKQFSLWLVRRDGTGRRRLLSTSHLSTLGMSWSPDGTEIAITSPGANANLHDARCTKLTVYLVPIDGGPVSSLHSGVGCDVAWTPGGAEIAYTPNGDGRSGAWAIRPDGTGKRKISDVGSVNWSADGAQLLFGVVLHPRTGISNRYSAFGVINADGTNRHVVTTHAYTEYGEAWSPHGHLILYGRADRKGMYVIGSDGRNNHRVTRDAPPQAAWGAFAWSPTGGSIVYTTGSASNTDLYLIGSDGRGKVQLTSTPDLDIAPSWVAS